MQKKLNVAICLGLADFLPIIPGLILLQASLKMCRRKCVEQKNNKSVPVDQLQQDIHQPMCT